MLASLPAAAQADSRAHRLAREALIVDTHIDVPYRIHEAWVDVTVATPGGDFDYPRARSGGLDVAFMSIYTPAELAAPAENRQLAHELIDSVEALVGRAPDRFAIVTSPDQVERLRGGERILLALGMENGSPIVELDDLHAFHARGVRYVTLAHGRSNALSDSSYDKQRPWDGLSPFGMEVVTRMNRLGMMVDVSHLSDAAVTDVLEASRAPVIATHSSARRFTPGFERNLSDELIGAIARGGGVVHINFGSSFLTAKANAWYRGRDAAREAWSKRTGKPTQGPDADAFTERYREQHPFPYAELSHVLDHIDHVAELAGIDHVGIGSDFDGVGDSLPTGLKSVADYPALVAGLLERGYSEQDVRKILGGNLMRVWRAVDKVAAAARPET
ncbi:MAG TPA: dipeptidase [Xanthomonadaceae bacterium]|nr:dipeptidase [Xanthomonadaceae bacterium]